MKFSKILLSSVAICSLSMAATPAFADDNAEITALHAEVDALKAQLAALSAKVDKAAAPAATAKPATETAWKGAPESSGPAGVTFKPRGRMQMDIGSVTSPPGVTNTSLGVATEFRRVQLGAEGTLSGGIGYRVDAELANGPVELQDAYLTYKTGKTTITLGQQKTFSALEDMTSDLFTSFQERAAYIGAFGFTRRLGVSATYAGKEFLVQGGVFSDNATNLSADSNNSFSIDGRLVFNPKLGSDQLHLGVSGHYRSLNDLTNSVRYRARPFVHTTDVRLVDTKAFSATAEQSVGLESAYIHGPFHATAEGHWLTAKRTSLANPTFFGGYAEVGYFLTGGDSISYKGGVYDRIKPVHPMGKGGMGALEMNARYDVVDLNDAGIIGGTQKTYGLSMIWVPMDYVRFIANYGHIVLHNAAVVGTGTAATGNYDADSFGLRAQVDF